jgi:uncharacterized repeat protein (TIGR03803 family)
MFKGISGEYSPACACVLTLLVCPHVARAESVLHAFVGSPSDGAFPFAGVISDSEGNLYGTTTSGGTDNLGTVFKVAPDGTETLLHSFRGGNDGAGPYGGLILDKKGNLYGTTGAGGVVSEPCKAGCGTVFKLAPDGKETVLYAFQGGSDGSGPVGRLIVDKQGNFYGATDFGGNTNCRSTLGCGTVFRLAGGGGETVLYEFCSLGGCTDGSHPEAGLARDGAGNLYGTTQRGGIVQGDVCQTDGCGTVFKLSPDGTETVLHPFAGDPDGNAPLAGLTLDKAGNLYGTTQLGGVVNEGTIFKVTPNGTESVLYSFCPTMKCTDGYYPYAGVILDKSGNLYGTAESGGASGYGAVFKYSADGTETVLHSFDRSDGAYPEAGLRADSHGNLYGTTTEGGNNDSCDGGPPSGCGTVFTLKR